MSPAAQLDSSDAEDLTRDGSLLKTILEEGTGDEAGRSARVALRYTLRLSDDDAGEEVDSSSKRKDGLLEFTLGRKKVIPALELIAQSMKTGERCRARAAAPYAFGSKGLKRKGVPPNAPVFLWVEMVRFEGGEEKKALADMSPAERFEQARLCKENGNGYFKEQKFDRALEQYSQSIRYLSNVFYVPSPILADSTASSIRSQPAVGSQEDESSSGTTATADPSAEQSRDENQNAEDASGDQKVDEGFQEADVTNGDTTAKSPGVGDQDRQTDDYDSENPAVEGSEADEVAENLVNRVVRDVVDGDDSLPPNAGNDDRQSKSPAYVANGTSRDAGSPSESEDEDNSPGTKKGSANSVSSQVQNTTEKAETPEQQELPAPENRPAQSATESPADISRIEDRQADGKIDDTATKRNEEASSADSPEAIREKSVDPAIAAARAVENSTSANAGVNAGKENGDLQASASDEADTQTGPPTESEVTADPEEDEVRSLHVTTLNNLSLCFVKLEDYKRAVETASQALRIDPQSSKALYYRGRAAIALGDWQQARSDLVAAAKIQPNNPGIRNEIIKLDRKMKQFEEKEKKRAAAMFA